MIQFKAIRRSPEHHKTIPRIPFPPLMAKRHKNVELVMDFFFVNGSPFLHIKSRKMYFRSVQAYNNRGKSETILGLKQVNTKYKDRCFTITYYHCDNEFEHLSNFLVPAHLNTCAVNEHIGDIKISIRTIKEQMRCGCHSIPYNKFKKLMTISLVQYIITCLNMFPSKNGISSDLSPAAIVLGYLNTDYNKLNFSFGAYAQVYIDTTNSIKQRMVGAVALRPANESSGISLCY